MITTRNESGQLNEEPLDLMGVVSVDFFRSILIVLVLMFSNSSWAQSQTVIFTDITKEAGIDFRYTFGDYVYENILESSGSGVTVFDYDDDGDLDLFQGNDHQMNFLFRNDGGNNFKNVALESGVAANDQGLPTGSMHGSIGDVDADGMIDLLVTDLRHGSLYRNLESGLFEEITEQSGLARLFAGKGAWAAALFDFDNDGDLDIFSELGAKVNVYAGGKKQVATHQFATSNLSYNDTRMHFGLGKDRQIERLKIQWPDNKTEVFHNIDADRYLTVTQNKGLQ